MTDPTEIDPGEELLGRVGISHALSRSDKAIRVFKNSPEAAEQVDECARRFVAGEKPDAPPPLPTFNYDDALEQLSTLKEPNHVALRYLDSHLIAAYQVAIDRAVKYLAGIVPRETVTTMSTTRNLRPSPMKIAKFRRIWGVADDVTSVFRSLEAGTLVADQAIALQVIFPTVFDALKMALLGEIADRTGKDKTWTLSYAKDQLLQVMLLTSIDDPGAMDRLQKNFADAKAAQGAPGDQPGPKGSTKSSLETPIQRASQ